MADKDRSELQPDKLFDEEIVREQPLSQEEIEKLAAEALVRVRKATLPKETA